MHVVSVNVSELRTVEHNGRTFKTGIYKAPVTGRVGVRSLGIDGDAQGDKRHHGGVDMAVYAYTAENYDFWRRQLGRDDIPHGMFGENLTTAGLDEADVCIGDRFRIGPEVVVEVSVPRAPCSTFAMVMGDTGFPKRFLAELRMGFYLRVVQEGETGAGDAIERVQAHPARLSIAEVTRLMHFDKANRAGVQRAIGVAELSEKWRERFQAMLA